MRWAVIELATSATTYFETIPHHVSLIVSSFGAACPPAKLYSNSQQLRDEFIRSLQMIAKTELMDCWHLVEAGEHEPTVTGEAASQ